jgi:integrase
MKTRRSHRLVSLPVEGMAALVRQRERLAEWAQRSGYTDLGLVFPKRDGTYRTGDHARRNLQEIARAAGLPVCTFHDLRHLHASLALWLGADAKTLQARLGHSSINVTMTTYAHLIGGQDRALADRLGGVLEPQANMTLTVADERGIHQEGNSQEPA